MDKALQSNLSNSIKWGFMGKHKGSYIDYPNCSACYFRGVIMQYYNYLMSMSYFTNWSHFMFYNDVRHNIIQIHNNVAGDSQYST